MLFDDLELYYRFYCVYKYIKVLGSIYFSGLGVWTSKFLVLILLPCQMKNNLSTLFLVYGMICLQGFCAYHLLMKLTKNI